jgi:hypothetical protein
MTPMNQLSDRARGFITDMNKLKDITEIQYNYKKKSIKVRTASSTLYEFVSDEGESKSILYHISDF